MIAAPTLTWRRIDPDADAELVVSARRDACVETFGDDAHFEGARQYLATLRDKVDEFPDGHVIAFLDGKWVGQLELEVPYGKSVGYANLYYVAPAFRGLGFGRHLERYAERYFRSWEADRAELHVARTNERALGFYQAMGYRLVPSPAGGSGLWLMAKALR